jgi:hypothetical protein
MSNYKPLQKKDKIRSLKLNSKTKTKQQIKQPLLSEKKKNQNIISFFNHKTN